MFGRRAFLSNAMVWVPAGAAALGALLAACMEDDSGSTCDTSGDFSDSIASNHGHSVDLTQAQVNAAQPVTLTLTEGDGHTHTVMLTAAVLADIGAGTQVKVESSTESGHSHAVTFNCSSGGGGGGGYGYLQSRKRS